MPGIREPPADAEICLCLHELTTDLSPEESAAMCRGIVPCIHFYLASSIRRRHSSFMQRQHLPWETACYLQGSILGIPPPEGAVHVAHHSSLQVASIGQVGPSTQVHHVPRAVEGDNAAAWQATNNFRFELIFLKHGQSLLSGDLDPLEALLCLDYLLTAAAVMPSNAT